MDTIPNYHTVRVPKLGKATAKSDLPKISKVIVNLEIPNLYKVTVNSKPSNLDKVAAKSDRPKINKVSASLETSNLDKVTANSEAPNIDKVITNSEALNLDKVTDNSDVLQLHKVTANPDASQLDKVTANTDAQQVDKVIANTEALNFDKVAANTDAPQLDKVTANSEAHKVDKVAANTDAPPLDKLTKNSDVPQLGKDTANSKDPKLNKVPKYSSIPTFYSKHFTIKVTTTDPNLFLTGETDINITDFDNDIFILFRKPDGSIVEPFKLNLNPNYSRGQSNFTFNAKRDNITPAIPISVVLLAVRMLTSALISVAIQIYFKASEFMDTQPGNKKLLMMLGIYTPNDVIIRDNRRLVRGSRRGYVPGNMLPVEIRLSRNGRLALRGRGMLIIKDN